MEQFNILKIFNCFNNETYCLIKKSEIFPKYKFGCDFDIFCFNAISVSEKIISYFNQYIDDNIKVRLNTNKYKIVVDILENDIIHLRFDLYQKLPNFKNIHVRGSLFSSVIENHQKQIYDGVEIFIPSDIDEAIIRYLEYHEWFDSRPDKIKHVKMIELFLINKKIEELNFLNKVHYYLKFPLNLDSRRVSQNSYLRKLYSFLRKFKTAYIYFKENGLIKTLKFSLNKLKS